MRRRVSGRPAGVAVPPAILLGGGVTALSAARNLAAAGVEVHALGHRVDPVQHSRACASFTDVGSGQGVQDRCLAWLEELRHPGAVLLPCDDNSLNLIACRRDQLVAMGYRPVESDDRLVLAMLDKERTYGLARDLGVPVPRTVRLSRREDAAQALAEIPPPCALKPLHAHHFAAHFGIHRKVVLVERPAQLERALAEMEQLGVEMLLTEIIPGRDDSFVSYYTYLDAAGEPLFHFTKRKLRQYPVGFGLVCYQVTEWHPDAAELGLRFMQGVGIRGAAYVELKRDARDGRFKLIECNHRFSASNALVTAAGVDVPLVAYRCAAGMPPPRIEGFRTGLRMWHVVEDLRAAPEYRRRGEWTLWQWARSLLRRQRFVLWKRDDPRPSAVAAFRYAARGIRRLVGARPRARRPAAEVRT